MEYRSPAPIFALLLAMVGGSLLAFGNYLAGAVLAVLAIVVFAMWQFANDRGDDDRHTIW